MQKSFKLKVILTLMLVLFIDGMGQGIIFPVLVHVISTSQFIWLSQATSTIKNLTYGVLVGVYYLMWFISAPILGGWSDYVGRKKALLVCLVLAAISFFLSAFAFAIASLSLLLFGRLLGGITSGDQAIAKAAIIDNCPADKKPIYLGLILGAVTLGLVLGPLIGAVLQNNNLITWFNMQIPFYFSCILTIANIFLLQRYFVELPVKRKKKNSLKVIKLFVDAFYEKRIRLLLLSYCLTQIGWQMLYIYLPFFFAIKFHMSATQTGSLLAMIGIGIGFGLTVLPYLCKKISEKTIAIVAYFGLFIGNMLLLLTDTVWLIWVIVIPIASFFGLAAVNVLSLFSNRVSPERQGWMMGITGSIVALTGGIGALLVGLLAGINIDAPYLFSSGVITLGIAILIVS